MNNSGMEESLILKQLFLGIDSLNLILMATAVFIIFLSIREYKKSTVSATFVYFLNGTLILGAIRVFFLLAENDIIRIHGISFMVAWHLLFYFATIMFLIASRALIRLASVTEKKESMTRAIAFIFLGFIFIFLVYLIISNFDSYFVKNLEESWIESFGVFHFVAFVMAGLVAFYIYSVKKKFEGDIGAIAIPLQISIAILSLIHLWELLTENWKVVIVDEYIIEMVEGILWIPVFIFILYAFIRLRGLTKIPLE